MKKLSVFVVALAATVSMGAHAATEYTKQITAQMSRDAQTLSGANPVYASYSTAVTVGTLQGVAMTVNGAVGYAGYAVERLVVNAVESGECAVGTANLAEGVTCIIQVPGKVVTVLLVDAGNLAAGVVVSVLDGVAAHLLHATAGLLNQVGANLGVAGLPFLVISAALEGAAIVVHAVAYVVEFAVTTVVNTVACIVSLPFEALGQLLTGALPQALWNVTFGLVEHFFHGIAHIIAALPPSPCDGVGKDHLCGAHSTPAP